MSPKRRWHRRWKTFTSARRAWAAGPTTRRNELGRCAGRTRRDVLFGSPGAGRFAPKRCTAGRFTILLQSDTQANVGGVPPTRSYRRPGSNLCRLLPHTSEPSITQRRPLNDSLCYEVITFTTVGYGNIIPATAQGKLLAICTALLGSTHGVTFVALVLQALTQHPAGKGQE